MRDLYCILKFIVVGELNGVNVLRVVLCGSLQQLVQRRDSLCGFSSPRCHKARLDRQEGSYEWSRRLYSHLASRATSLT